MSESARGLPRVAVLPAYVEIMLGVGDVDAAATACRELDEIAAQQDSEAINAMSGHARGALSLAEGDVQAAVPALRHAWSAWHQLDAPYEAARRGSRAWLHVSTLGACPDAMSAVPDATPRCLVF